MSDLYRVVYRHETGEEETLLNNVDQDTAYSYFDDHFDPECEGNMWVEQYANPHDEYMRRLWNDELDFY